MAAKYSSPRAQDPRQWCPMARPMCARHLGSRVSARPDCYAHYWDLTLVPPNSVIGVDCQKAISEVLCERRPMKQAYWVLAVRDSLRAGNQSVVWVGGHSGEEHDETADYFAAITTQLPAPSATKSTEPWDLVVFGKRVLDPHKVWTKRQTRTHRHEGFHPWTFVPLRWKRVGRHKWICGLHQRMGFQHYATLWSNDQPKQECTSCWNRQYTTVHEYIVYCHDANPLVPHPLVQSWYSAWPNLGIVQAWWQLAQHKERRIAARLCILTSFECTPHKESMVCNCPC